MGINMQAAVEANRYINIRGIGNYFSYNVNNVKINGNSNGSGNSNGIDVSGNLNFAKAGVALDFYPWPNHGFRLSPGVMLYNQNGASGQRHSLRRNQHYARLGQVLFRSVRSLHHQRQPRAEHT